MKNDQQEFKYVFPNYIGTYMLFIQPGFSPMYSFNFRTNLLKPNPLVRNIYFPKANSMLLLKNNPEYEFYNKSTNTLEVEPYKINDSRYSNESQASEVPHDSFHLSDDGKSLILPHFGELSNSGRSLFTITLSDASEKSMSFDPFVGCNLNTNSFLSQDDADTSSSFSNVSTPSGHEKNGLGYFSQFMRFINS